MERPRHPDSSRRVTQPPPSHLARQDSRATSRGAGDAVGSFYLGQTARQRPKVKGKVDAIICCAARHLPQEDPFSALSLIPTSRKTTPKLPASPEAPILRKEEGGRRKEYRPCPKLCLREPVWEELELGNATPFLVSSVLPPRPAPNS
ncbi:hypothetical protein MUK42_02914 [Musa troglodytarum]|uniref:Uncharacterized protein n=1 Tax=Musa troglodytarum TaxID=320322 RepID=A0A9E7EQB1_9LILI|nr:hypothetical protein MUK42_02914 [Musa troglodytarum]